MKEALERFAVAVPRLSDISKGEWAASQVILISDSLDALDDDSFDLYEAIYDLYTMQTYIAYGLSCSSSSFL